MSDGMSHWTIQKRFLDFDALDGDLAHKYPKYMLNIDRLPPKITFNNMTPDLLETRQKIFDLYLKQLLRGELLSSPELCEFLEAPAEMAAFSDDEYIEYDLDPQASACKSATSDLSSNEMSAARGL